jgi:glucosyl-3-phosphoglycerate synthase
MVSRDQRQRSHVRTFDAHGWTAEAVAAAKGGETISVCIPCKNEESTVGAIVSIIRGELVEEVGLVDEIVILNDRSTDATAQVAAAAGAVVVHVDDVAGDLPTGRGKGNVLWSSLLASKGDLVVWCDADLTSFTSDWIAKLVAPLLLDQTVDLVKGLYLRPTDIAGQGGGRTTELAARPLLSLLYPDLALLAQPLSGEVAGRRSVLEQLEFVQGWGVEVAVLVDILNLHGANAIAQVDLGVRKHRHRPLVDLSVQAAEIALTLLLRSGSVDIGDVEQVLRRPDGTVVELNVARRPPVVSLGRT